ncbi:hypothetical protein [Streptomyces sp. WAC 00631]|uniref:hypothetical protein n=1 Tax=Streptomyces sp. WAC 00631 TaxID=2203201 RepID=UPI001C8C9672
MPLPVDDAPRLVRDTLAGLEARIPAIRDCTAAQRRHTAEDIAHIADFLATTLYTGDPRLFTGFLTWTGGILTARGVPGADRPGGHRTLTSPGPTAGLVSRSTPVVTGRAG